MRFRFPVQPIAAGLVGAFMSTAIYAGEAGLASKYPTDALEKDFTKFDRPGISDVKADSLIGVFDPILRGHPESMDGNAAAKIAFEKNSSGDAFVVEIELDGLLDDSVSGQKFVGFVGPAADGGWQLQSLWLRQKCGRGDVAGQWVKGNCG